MIRATAETLNSGNPRSVQYGAEHWSDGCEAVGLKSVAVPQKNPYGVSRGDSGLPTHSTGEFIPTLDQIRQGCLKIQAGWSEAERLRRGAYLKPTYARTAVGAGC